MKMNLAWFGVSCLAMVLASCGGGKKDINRGTNDRRNRENPGAVVVQPPPQRPGQPGGGGPGSGKPGAGPGPSRPGEVRNWSQIGRTTMKYAANKTRLDVRGDRNRYGELQLSITGQPVQVFDIQMIFTDGSKWTSVVNQRFDRNASTRAIRLPDNRRALERVFVTYQSTTRNGQTTLTLNGR